MDASLCPVCHADHRVSVRFVPPPCLVRQVEVAIKAISVEPPRKHSTHAVGEYRFPAELGGGDSVLVVAA